MALRKIISGGQTDAGQAALDVAIWLDIPHGSWIPKSWPTEKGILPDRYQLTEMPTNSYPKGTEQSIVGSDGTIIFSYGRLTGGAALTSRMTIRHNHPWLHIDFTPDPHFQAAPVVTDWLRQNSIEMLISLTSEGGSTADDCIVLILRELWVEPKKRKVQGS